MRRVLVVNADDFGRSAGINRGIARAHERGVVTSTSLMVRWSSATEAAAYARSHPELGVGLHIDLGEWIVREGSWEPAYEVVRAGDDEAAASEVEWQLEQFRELVGRDPTHLDSHQHVHREGPVREIVAAAGSRLDVPVRGEAIPYIGSFYGQTGKGEALSGGVSVEHLSGILRALPRGICELGCHPGEGTDPDSPYNFERAIETRTLCDPRIRSVIAEEQIELRSFAWPERAVAR